MFFPSPTNSSCPSHPFPPTVRGGHHHPSPPPTTKAESHHDHHTGDAHPPRHNTRLVILWLFLVTLTPAPALSADPAVELRKRRFGSGQVRPTSTSTAVWCYISSLLFSQASRLSLSPSPSRSLPPAQKIPPATAQKIDSGDNPEAYSLLHRRFPFVKTIMMGNDTEDYDSFSKPVGRRSVLYYGVGHMLNDITSACWFTYLLSFLTDIGLSPRDAATVMLSGQVADEFTTIFAGELVVWN